MRSFRRSPGAEHLVHLVELPELSRRRRPSATRHDGRQANEERQAQGTAATNGAGPGVGQPGPGHRPNGMHTFRARRDPGGFASVTSAGGTGKARPLQPELRELDVPRPPAPAPRLAGAGVHPAHGDATPDEARIELLERRLAKLARLVAERDEQLQTRSEAGTREPGLASVYHDVQGLRGQSEEAQRKRSLMSSIFEANRKLRERISFTAQDAE